MRIMLLSANTGEGHNSSARAILEVLQQRGVECDIQDCLAFLSPGFSRFISQWHSRIYQYGGKIFDKGYRYAENVSSPDNFNPVYELLSLGAGKLRDALVEGSYTCLVCLHPFAGIIATEARQSHGVQIPTFLVATDYTCSPTVEQSRLDTYFVPAPEISQEFTLAGIPVEKQCVSGIPVGQAFYRPKDRQAARKALDLPAQGSVVLVMCGSMGCGPIQRIVENTLSQMPDDGVMVAVCGKNEKLREELSLLTDSRLRVLGFIDNFPVYLDAADLIITKPGGLSSTEAANKHVPMVFINAVGGCESRNFDYFLKKEYARGSADPEEVERIAIRMIWDREGRRRMEENLQRDFSVNTGLLIADRIEKAAAL